MKKCVVYLLIFAVVLAGMLLFLIYDTPKTAVPKATVSPDYYVVMGHPMEDTVHIIIVRGGEE